MYFIFPPPSNGLVVEGVGGRDSAKEGEVAGSPANKLILKNHGNFCLTFMNEIHGFLNGLPLQSLSPKR